MIIHSFKYVLLPCLVLLCSNAYGQELSFDHGEIEFYTSTIMSDIEAFTETAEVKVNLATKKVEVKIDVRTFDFEYEMMQDHFNEEYMETDKFPYATFVGEVAQDIAELSQEQEVDVSGQLTLHGKTKSAEFKAKLSKENNYVVVKTKLPIIFKDYGIEEPSILTKSVAKEVELKCKIYLK